MFPETIRRFRFAGSYGNSGSGDKPLRCAKRTLFVVGDEACARLMRRVCEVPPQDSHRIAKIQGACALLHVGHWARSDETRVVVSHCRIGEYPVCKLVRVVGHRQGVGTILQGLTGSAFEFDHTISA